MKKIDWNDALESFLERKASVWQPTTVKFYEAQLRLLAEWAMERHLVFTSLKRADIERYMAERRKQVHVNTVRKDGDCARVLTRYWTAEGVFRTDPLRELQLPKREQTHIPVPSDDAIKALLRAVDQMYEPKANLQNHMTRSERSFLKARNRAMIETLLETGLRNSELCRLDTDDFDRENDSLTVRVSKSKRPRVVPITEELAETLRLWLKRRDREPLQTEALFPSILGERMTRDGVHKMLDKYWQFAQVPPKTTHSLRHYALRNLTRHGSIKTAQRIAGHSSIKTTSAYAELEEDAIREDVQMAGTLRRLQAQSHEETEPVRKKRVVR